VLASLPVHFAVDDHEFADNFPGSPVVTSTSSAPPARYRPSAENFGTRVRAGQLSSDEFDFARLMACAYLGSGRDLAPFGTSSAGQEQLWYALEHGNEFPCPAFVLDTRSERRPASMGQRPRLMGDVQLQALLEWLVRSASERPDDPKFIFSGSVIAPLPRDATHAGRYLREDGLAAYPYELDTIVRMIVNHQVRRVVFVGGDLHLSAGCRLSLSSGARTVAALQIVASGLYAPLPFANFPPSAVDWDRSSSIELGGSRIDYTPQLLHAGSSHFVHVSASRSGAAWEIGLAAYRAARVPVNRLSFSI
jgi:cholesterol oxidase